MRPTTSSMKSVYDAFEFSSVGRCKELTEWQFRSFVEKCNENTPVDVIRVNSVSIILFAKRCYCSECSLYFKEYVRETQQVQRKKPFYAHMCRLFRCTPSLVLVTMGSLAQQVGSPS